MDRVVPSYSSVQDMLRVGQDSISFVCHISSFQFHFKADAFRHMLGHLDVYTFPLYGLIWRVINRIMMSFGLRMVLLVPC